MPKRSAEETGEIFLISTGTLIPRTLSWLASRKPNMKVLAILDFCPRATEISGVPVLGLSRLNNLSLRMGITTVYTAVPDEALKTAQNAAENAGIPIIRNLKESDLCSL